LWDREVNDLEVDDIVLERISEALQKEGLPLFASNAEAIQAIEDEQEREVRSLEIAIRHLEAAGPGAVPSDVMEAVKAEIKKAEEEGWPGPRRAIAKWR
jgi:hypothetical protein